MTSRACQVVVVTNVYPDQEHPDRGVFVRNIVESLREEGLAVEVVTRDFVDTPVSAKLADYLRFYRSVMRLMRAHPSALVYPHYVSHCAPPILWALALGAKNRVVSHVHGSDVLPEKGTSAFASKIKARLATAILARSALVVVPSPYYARVLETRYQVPCHKLLVSPSGGVDLSVFRPAGDIERDSGVVRLGFVGRLIEEKGILEFIDLFDRLTDAGLTVRGSIIGDGPQRDRVVAATRERGMSYLPRCEQAALADFYRDLDLFIFPTRRQAESLGLVGLEAMACGAPVVAYRGAGPETYIEDGVSGFLVDPGSIDGLVHAVMCFQDPGFDRAAMAAAAVAAAAAYSATQVRQELADRFRLLLAV